MQGYLLPFDALDSSERMVLSESLLEFFDRTSLPLQLRFDPAVREIPDEPPDAEGNGAVPNEQTEVHTLHPAGEPESHPDGDHVRQPSDLK